MVMAWMVESKMMGLKKSKKMTQKGLMSIYPTVQSNNTIRPSKQSKKNCRKD